MAAEIHPRPQTRKPVLLSKIEGFQDVVNTAVIIPKEDGVISVSQDRTIRVWLKRDSGQYWPSVYHTMPVACSCMSFNPETRRISLGLENGTVSVCLLNIIHTHTCFLHSNMSLAGSQMVCLFVVVSYPHNHRIHAYIHKILYDGNKYSIPYLTLNLLKAAMCVFMCAGNVTALCWDPVQRVLFSGSSDHSIIMWDIGGRKGTAFELQGHNDKVQGLCYASHTRQLISCGSDGGIVIWSMDVTRQETPEWLDSDSCQKCEQPFFWNFKQMWDSKKIGLRQHHCRKCGQAVCGKCSSKRSTIPLMGFEFEVRVCDSCHDSITDEERAPTATFHDSKHSIIHMQYEPTRGWLLTSGTDKIIKVNLTHIITNIVVYTG
uniref:WD repeat and FYVE domain containing 2 n=1 Tax=Cyprinus carpio TaxID=7962 RepID=A0A8C2HSR3_CYPCA